RQKKQSTIQEISYTPCPFCRGRGVRPSLEYTALTAYRKIETQAVKGLSSVIGLSVPYEVADYLQNQKRAEISRLENDYDMSIHISGSPDMAWDEWKIETTKRETPVAPEQTNHVRKASEEIEEPDEPEEPEAGEADIPAPGAADEPKQIEPGKDGPQRGTPKRGPRRKGPPKNVSPKEEKPRGEEFGQEEPGHNADSPTENREAAPEKAKKRSRRRPRRRRKTPGEKPAETSSAAPQMSAAEHRPEAPPREMVRITPPPTAVEPAAPKISVSQPSEIPKGKAPPENQGRGNGNLEDPLHRLKKVFEALED
ncbi:MAG: hypothetical protein NTW71_08695, partial [Deltaproteobacteria bacterium]|nr:hypothetical protein [Deltaproteobacteria bacterium]